MDPHVRKSWPAADGCQSKGGVVKKLIGLAAVVLAATTPAWAQVTISDWRGASLTVEAGTVDNDGVRIAYHTAGEGPLVVFVHSISGPWFDWRHQMVALAADYRVVAMSTRGTDRSDKPQGVEHYTMAKISSDIDALIRHFGEERAIIIGQDSGGLYAWHFAMTHPERVERLVSVGTVHPEGLIRELAANPAQQEASTFQRGMQENPNAGTQFGQRMRNARPRPGDSDNLARLRKEAYERLDGESVANFYRANWPRPPFTPETEGFGFRPGEFPPVQAPTLLIYGEDSGPFTNGTLDGTWQWVDGRLTIHVLPGVGHGPHTEVPDFVTPTILEWLASE